MESLFFILPIMFITLSAWLAVRLVKRGANKKKALFMQICSVAVMMAGCIFTCAASSNASAAGNATTSSAAASSEGQTSSASGAANAFGIGLIAAALVTGLSGIGGGIAVASAAPAAIAATSEDPKAFGKALIFVALGEGIALYGLLVSIMIFNKLDQLKF